MLVLDVGEMLERLFVALRNELTDAGMITKSGEPELGDTTGSARFTIDNELGGKERRCLLLRRVCALFGLFLIIVFGVRELLLVLDLLIMSLFEFLRGREGFSGDDFESARVEGSG